MTKVALNCKTLVTKTKQALKKVQIKYMEPRKDIGGFWGYTKVVC